MTSFATVDRVPTSFEVLPNGIFIELGRKERNGEVGFIARRGDRYGIVSCVECYGKRYIPVSESPTVLSALRLPTRAAPYASTRELFSDVCKLLNEYSDLPEPFVSKVAYFIFGTWLVERLSIAPLLSIAAPGTASRTALLYLLGLLCRHSFFVTAENPAGLWTLPMYLRPTLLLDVGELTTPVRKFLRASHAQGVHFLAKGQARELYCAKAVCSPEPLRDSLLASSALQISFLSANREVPALTEEAGERIADEFQAKLLMYRAQNYFKARPLNFERSGLIAPTQCLAGSLAACIIDDPKLQADLVPLLHQQEEEFQAERSLGLETLILEVLLNCCHEDGRSTVRAAEVAEMANQVLAQRGETLQISPETVGRRLKSLGLRTEPIGTRGNGLWLLSTTRRTIHNLAGEYGVGPCSHCSPSLNRKLEPDHRPSDGNMLPQP